MALAPEAVLDRRLVKKGNRAIPQVLIKWTHLPSTSATWEDFYVVQQRFLSLFAWDKQDLQRGEMSRRQQNEGGKHQEVFNGVRPSSTCVWRVSVWGPRAVVVYERTKQKLNLK